MISKSVLVIISASVIALGMAVTSTALSVATGESPSQISDKPNAPRYSEICPHGHNGFNCKTTSYRADIIDLQERVEELEKRR